MYLRPTTQVVARECRPARRLASGACCRCSANSLTAGHEDCLPRLRRREILAWHEQRTPRRDGDAAAPSLRPDEPASARRRCRAWREGRGASALLSPPVRIGLSCAGRLGGADPPRSPGVGLRATGIRPARHSCSLSSAVISWPVAAVADDTAASAAETSCRCRTLGELERSSAADAKPLARS